jgi:GNAT superfamily N-acetyltransferase
LDAQPERTAPPLIPKGMRPGRREFRDASLTVAIPTCVPEHMRERTREITHLFVAPESRRQKLATVLMNLVCQEADANQMTLVLTAHEYDEPAMHDDEKTAAVPPPDEVKLVDWYQRFGFIVLQVTPAGTFMARQVRERPRVKPVTLAVARALDEALH